jgi:glyoxylase-like metal-dependent hydrolase (beta-lactamase superfamily II)
MILVYDEFGPVLTNSYIVIDKSTRYAVVIDVPPASLDFINDVLAKQEAEIKEIWLTHSHWDHTADAPALRDIYDVPVRVHRADEYRLQEPNKYVGFPLPFTMRGINADSYFEEGDTLLLGHLKFRVLETPGHTEGGVIFINDEHKTVIAGDTIFKQSIGRTDLHGGDFDTLIESIRTKILTLDDDYSLYPGHGVKTTVGSEKRFNPFLQQLAQD